MAQVRKSKLLDVLEGKVHDVPPMWLMRQAGRYLPEYLRTREEAGSFLDLCYNPELACEVTMQPIRRFDFDAAILFSDILVIPDALDRGVHFVKGEGPRMTPIDVAGIEALENLREGVVSHLSPVMETVTRIRSALADDKALLGFCGAPWTVATYMIAGRGTPDQGPARQFYYRDRDSFIRLLNLLADVSADYLIAQIDAGADAVQVFDSWASVLDAASFEECCIAPVRRLTDRVRAARPEAKIIGFPKGAGSLYAGYREAAGVDCLGLDWAVSWDQAKALQKDAPVQGNLDPMRLLIGGDALREGVDRIMQNLSEGPLIFNLGHGITPDVPIAHVEELMTLVRDR
ncbi:MAG: uroporphyrinogen decarboxylase [Pseudomonadota bacterium]